jgi:hypothetical protein
MARWTWTIGCGIYLIHVLIAFHLLHAWSHTAAYEHVMKRTQEMIGIASGIGLYVNYAFGVLWIADVLMWWRRLDWSDRPVPYRTVQSVFAFLIIQATVVFGPWLWMPVSAAVVVLLAALWSTRRRIAAG